MTNLKRDVEDAVERAMGEFRERLMEIEVMSLHPEREAEMMRKVCELSYLVEALRPHFVFIEEKWPELSNILSELRGIRGYCDIVAKSKESIGASTRSILMELKESRK